ncbi:MAG: DNA primase, partial [Deltaproteobacteria bacterium]|nr:DNA primase [Deltaproteobacteria bacterium]
STAKAANTGRLTTEAYRVAGPVSIFTTTTAIEVDEELLNRCIVLTVDEDRDQTKAIHKLQRERQTLEGLLAGREREEIVTRHHNAQRLLKQLLVANPFAKQLTFLDDRTRTRRDHMKYLTLIRAVALLHQYQRPVKHIEHHGRSMPYIEVEPGDIVVANKLASQVLGRSLDELAPQTRRLLSLLDSMVSAACKRLEMPRQELRFTRRQVREQIGWSYKQVRVHLSRLVEMEYVIIHRGGHGQQLVYELLYDGQGQDGLPFVMGLIDAESLKSNSTTTTLPTSKGEFAHALPGHCPSIAQGVPDTETGSEPSNNKGFGDSLPGLPRNANSPLQKSYSGRRSGEVG